MPLENDKKVATTHALEEVWNHQPGLFNRKSAPTKLPSIEKIFADFFTVGDYYYYILEISTGNLFHQNSSILNHHDFASPPTHLNAIMDLIHPEGLKAEKACYDKVLEIGKQHLPELKSSYCFRMRTQKGVYHLYHHPAIHITVAESGEVLQSVNIHTNIQHITSHNNYTALLSGIGTREDYYQLQVLENDYPLIKTCLTRREIQIVVLIAKGLSTAEIATQLSISTYTLDTHRKNILQ